MTRKYALVNNLVITDIKNLTESEFLVEISRNNMVVDIEDVVPQPQLRWVLNGNRFEIPQGASSREQFEIALAEKKMDFGSSLAKFCVARVGARNKILNKDAQQVTNILNSLMPVKLLMETGALGTARLVCQNLLSVYTEYADIFQHVINEINSFENSHGL